MQEKLKEFSAPMLLSGIFIISRLFYWSVGIRFFAETYTWIWHFIDSVYLKTDLWRSIFYMHTQPPLMNLLTGFGLQLFPENYGKVFQTIYLLSGLFLILAIYFIGNKLGLPKYLSVFVAAWFSISPATIVYENQLFYTYPTTVLLILSTVFFVRFINKKRFVDGILFSLILALNALTWGLFHLFWLAICFGIAAYFIKGPVQKMLWLLPAFFLVFAWYAKNGILYGSFTSSTWAGLNVYKMVSGRVPEKQMKQWVKDGVVSDFVFVPPYRSAEVYLRYFPETPVTGIPLLDDYNNSKGGRNQHHISYVFASERYTKDALSILVHAPQYYIRTVANAFYIYFHSASDYEHTLAIRRPIEKLDTFWNRLFYGQWQKDETLQERASIISLDHVAWLPLFSFLFVILATPVYLWRERKRIYSIEYGLILFMFWNIIFVSAAGILLDIGENNRTRFSIDPFVLLMTFFFLQKIFFRKRSANFTPHNI